MSQCLDKGFFCSSVLIDLFGILSFVLLVRHPVLLCLFRVWENGRRGLHGYGVLIYLEEGEQGDARRWRFEAASLYMDGDKHPSGEALDVRYLGD